jgi:hypothetical protein
MQNYESFVSIEIHQNRTNNERKNAKIVKFRDGVSQKTGS